MLGEAEMRAHDRTLADHERRWTPQYTAYAATHGRTPSEQLTHDQSVFPGGCMVGFILWMSARERVFRQTRPECYANGRIADLEAWMRFVSDGVQPQTSNPSHVHACADSRRGSAS